MMDNQEGQKVRIDADKVIVLGPSFDFWLNEEDDIYDELYVKRETEEGPRVPRAGEFPRQS